MEDGDGADDGGAGDDGCVAMIGVMKFSQSIFELKYQLNLLENDFLIRNIKLGEQLSLATLSIIF